MVGGKPDTSKSNSRKKRESLGINQLERPVEAGEEVGEREKERTVKELAISVERGIEEGIYNNNSNNSEQGWYFQNDMPGTSAMALADEAAANYQAAAASYYVEDEQFEEPETDTDPELLSGLIATEEDTTELMEIDETPTHHFTPNEIDDMLGSETEKLETNETDVSVMTQPPILTSEDEIHISPQKAVRTVMESIGSDHGLNNKQLGSEIAKGVNAILQMNTEENQSNSKILKAELIDLVQEEKHDKVDPESNKKSRDPKVIMRFYNEKGRCLVCDKAYKS